MCLVCFNLITLKVWKSGNVSGMIWELKMGLARGKMTGVTSDCCQSQDGDIASFSSPPGHIFLYLFFQEENGRPFCTECDCAGLAFKKYDWRPSKHKGVLH